MNNLIEILFLLLMSLLFDTSLNMLNYNGGTIPLFIIAVILSVIYSIVHKKNNNSISKYNDLSIIKEGNIKEALKNLALSEASLVYFKNSIKNITISTFSLIALLAGLLLNNTFLIILHIFTVTFYLMHEYINYKNFKNLVVFTKQENSNIYLSDADGNEFTDAEAKDFINRIINDINESDDKE